MTQELTERKKVLVLGGSSGIGKATSERFAKEGWAVFIAAYDLQQAEEVAAGLEGEGHHACRMDVRKDEDIENLRRKIIELFGSLNVLVNSIGISESCSVLEESFDKWDNSLQVMLYGTLKSCRALVPLINDGGRIIHITSIHHERVSKGSSAYGMSKAAITQLTRSLAVELAPRNILANTIAPGFINTPMSIKKPGTNELDSKWFKDNYVMYDHLPLKRAGRPEEVSGIVYFLAGPDASYITGSVITVDGGLTITF